MHKVDPRARQVLEQRSLAPRVIASRSSAVKWDDAVALGLIVSRPRRIGGRLRVVTNKLLMFLLERRQSPPRVPPRTKRASAIRRCIPRSLLRRAAKAQGLQPPNHKRICRVMIAHGLLLQRYAGGAEERRHDGRIAVDRSNLRWCSDGRTGCDNGDKVRVAFALDCCDREVMGFVATTEGIKGEDVRDLMVTAVERNMPEL